MNICRPNYLKANVCWYPAKIKHIFDHILSFVSSQLWLSFAPVADQSARYLKVGLEQVNWLSIIYMIVAIPLSFATSWMLDVLGLRITVHLALDINKEPVLCWEDSATKY